MFRWIGGCLAASLSVYLVGSVLMTQVVLANVTGFGVAVDLPSRLSMTLADLGGLSTSYLPLVVIAMVIAMLIATLLGRAIPRRRSVLILLAGLTAPPTLVFVMTLTFGMNPLAGAAGAGGLLLQAVAGLAGGFVFQGIAGPRDTGE